MIGMLRFTKQIIRERMKALMYLYLSSVAVAVIWMAFNYHTVAASIKTTVPLGTGAKLGMVFGVILLFSSMLTELIWQFWQAIYTARLNRSTTWRMAALSATKFQGATLLASVTTYLMLVLAQGVLVIISLLPAILQYRQFIKVNGEGIFDLLIITLVYLVGIICWFISINLLSLTANSISNIIPGGRSKFGVGVIRVVVVLAFLYLLSIVVQGYDRFADGQAGATYVWLVILVYAAYNVIVFTVNCLLFKYFYSAEAK